MLIAASATLYAQTQQPLCKVAVINMQAAITGTRDGQSAQQELAAKVGPKQKEFNNRTAEIAQLEDQLRKSGSVMSELSKQELTRSIDDKKKRLERDTQDADEEIQNEQQKWLQTLGQKMMAVVTKYAAENQYSIVLDDSNPSTPVLYAATAVDITKDVIAVYEKTKH